VRHGTRAAAGALVVCDLLMRSALAAASLFAPVSPAPASASRSNGDGGRSRGRSGGDSHLATLSASLASLQSAAGVQLALARVKALGLLLNMYTHERAEAARLRAAAGSSAASDSWFLKPVYCGLPSTDFVCWLQASHMAATLFPHLDLLAGLDTPGAVPGSSRSCSSSSSGMTIIGGAETGVRARAAMDRSSAGAASSAAAGTDSAAAAGAPRATGTAAAGGSASLLLPLGGFPTDLQGGSACFVGKGGFWGR
jgi:hypothetical protein